MVGKRQCLLLSQLLVTEFQISIFRADVCHELSHPPHPIPAITVPEFLARALTSLPSQAGMFRCLFSNSALMPAVPGCSPAVTTPG